MVISIEAEIGYIKEKYPSTMTWHEKGRVEEWRTQPGKAKT